MKVIGIDPGLADTGVGLVSGVGRSIKSHAYGTISTPKHEPITCRLATIYDKVRKTLEAEKPDLMVVEDVFSLKVFPRSGIVLGKVCGVLILAGTQCGVPLLEIPVRQAKQVLTGNGNASKKQLEAAVRRIVDAKTPIQPSHASDALGLALIGFFRNA